MNRQRHEPAEEQRREAIVAFLSAAVPGPVGRATLVKALASARRSVAAHARNGDDADRWLRAEVRLRGVREAAAVVAAAESGTPDPDVVAAFRLDHPERSTLLDRLLEVLRPAY